jgi:putative polyhydroxyalkanoate system protein
VPDIKVSRRHALPPARARLLAERTVDEFAARYGVATEWQGDVLRFRAHGAEGRVRLSGAELHVDVKLGLLLRPFKARVADRIEEHLDRLLRARKRKS